MRAAWKGAITFGLVNIPVEVFGATKDANRVSFRLLHKGCNSTIKYDRVCEKPKQSVPWEDITKGYEYQKGQFVVMDEEDFRAASVDSSKTVEIQEFVRTEDIDPRFFETPYFLTPQKGAEKGYALVRDAIRKTGMVGLGLITMRSNSQHLVGIKALGDALVMEVMRYSDSLVDPNGFTFPTSEQVRPQEAQLAEQLVGSMVGKFDPTKYQDEYTNNLKAIISDKLKGKKVQVKEPDEPQATSVNDLFAKLQESLVLPKRQRKVAAPVELEVPAKPKRARKVVTA